MPIAASSQIQDLLADVAAPKGQEGLESTLPRGGVVYLPIEPAGYPVTPEDFDFGGGSPTKEQIANASQFAQLVNQIPNSLQNTWVSTGRMTWNLWEAVLDSIQFPVGAPANQITDLRAGFQLDKRLDMLGNTYYQTNYTPQEFWKTTSSAWHRMSYSASSGTLTEDNVKVKRPRILAGDKPEVDLPVDAKGMNVTGDLILVTLLRPWWNAWLFESQNWRYAPGSITPPLSDGGDPPSGAMTMYPNAIMVARDVNVRLDMSSPRNRRLVKEADAAHDVSFGPFQLKGNNAHAGSLLRETKLEVTNDGLKSIGMQVVGFQCNLLPQCPNPSTAVTWPLM
ncbi:MAG: hypothetical protein R3C18_22890 [Planctomycetaceae bacterium]